MNKKILFCGIPGLIFFAIPFVAARSVKGPLPEEMPVFMYFFIILIILGIGIVAYYMYRGSKGDKTARQRESEVNALDNNFDELAAAEREDKLIKFLNDKNRTIRSDTAFILIKNFEKLNENFREKEILELSKNEYSSVRAEVASRLSEKLFALLPVNVRNELLKNLASDADELVRIYTVDTIRRNISDLPEKLQNLLEKFADDPEPGVRLRVAESIYTNFNSMPKNMREKIIKKLADDENPDVREKIKEAVKKHGKKLPGKLVNEILQDIEIL